MSKRFYEKQSRCLLAITQRMPNCEQQQHIINSTGLQGRSNWLLGTLLLDGLVHAINLLLEHLLRNISLELYPPIYQTSARHAQRTWTIITQLVRYLECRCQDVVLHRERLRRQMEGLDTFKAPQLHEVTQTQHNALSLMISCTPSKSTQRHYQIRRQQHTLAFLAAVSRSSATS